MRRSRKAPFIFAFLFLCGVPWSAETELPEWAIAVDADVVEGEKTVSTKPPQIQVPFAQKEDEKNRQEMDSSTEDDSEEDLDFDDFLDLETELELEEELAGFDGTIADPLIGWNMIWFHFNDRLYFWGLKPAAAGYGAITPRLVRKGVSNLFHNLGMPVRAVNCLCQGKFKASGAEFRNFCIDTTVGVAGLWDPSKKIFDDEPNKVDSDQTLGKAHIGKGIYLVWPIYGPSSVRGTFGLLMDTALNPATFLPGAGTLKHINARAQGDDAYETLTSSSIDPYRAIRNAYVQYRNKKVAE